MGGRASCQRRFLAHICSHQSSGTSWRCCGTLETTAARGEDRLVRFQGPTHRRRIHVPSGEVLVGQIAQELQFREQTRGVPESAWLMGSRRINKTIWVDRGLRSYYHGQDN